MDEIKQELLELGFNVDSVGMLYWIEAIKYIKEKPKIWDILEIYELVAEKCKTTPSRVERGLRTAIEPAKENIKKKYKYNNKIRNQTFLNIMRLKYI